MKIAGDSMPTLAEEHDEHDGDEHDGDDHDEESDD